MGTGFLQLQVFLGNQIYPAQSVVEVRDNTGALIATHNTCHNGICPKIELYAPQKDTSPPFSTYDITVIPNNTGLRKVTVHGIQIFDGIETILPVHVHPAVPVVSAENMPEDITISPKHGADIDRPYAPLVDDGVAHTSNPSTDIEVVPVASFKNAPLANEVPIPSYITVHLGAPSAPARNVRVPFKEYIKNVTSSEIYPNWTRTAMEANVLAITSFALNRIYTNWYRSRGRDFDITNNTQFDQMYIPGREIFQPVIDVVDDIFNNFLRRVGRREPYLSSYCNGTTSTCAGMSQWGSENMGRQGRSTIDILRHFYPDDIQIVQSTNFANRTGAYPGEALREGSRGENVRLMQQYLNRISGNWFMPPAGRADGIFGTQTLASVREFQRIFSLTSDGVIGRRTWYEITRVYTAVMELAELTSQGERIGIQEPTPTSTLLLNSRGEDVIELQFLLDYAAQFYENLRYVLITGVVNTDTVDAVKAFQHEFGLNADGVVGSRTWRMLYDVFYAIQANIPSITASASAITNDDAIMVFGQNMPKEDLIQDIVPISQNMKSSLGEKQTDRRDLITTIVLLVSLLLLKKR